MTASPSLMACPCGAPVDPDECPFPISVTGGFRIRCVNGDCGWSVVADTAEQAIAVWNRRATPPLPADWLAALDGEAQGTPFDGAQWDINPDGDRVIDLADESSNQLAIALQIDGSVTFAAYTDGNRLHGYALIDGTMTPDFKRGLQLFAARLATTPPPPAEPAAEGREALAAHLHKLIGEYWGLAYREGQENRTQDTEDGAAGRCLHEIQHTIKLLATHPAEASAQGGEERLRDERWRLLNSYGNGAFKDGQITARIAEIDNQLAPPPAPERAEPKCRTCNDVGMIGGWTGQTAESGGYDSEPCPDCAPQAAAQGEARDWAEDMVARELSGDYVIASDLAELPALPDAWQVRSTNASGYVSKWNIVNDDSDRPAQTGQWTHEYRPLYAAAQPIPANLVARLEELAKEWAAKSEMRYHPVMRRTYLICADELRAALAGVVS